MRSHCLLWDGADPKHRRVPQEGQGTGKQLPHPKQSCGGQSCCPPPAPLQTPTAARLHLPSITHGSWDGSSHLDTAPSTSQPNHKGKFKDRKKEAELQLLLWLCPSLGRPCAWGRSKLLLPSGAGKVTRNRLWHSHRGGHSLPVLSDPTQTTKLPHTWPVPGQLPPGISTQTANTAAGAKPETGDKEKPGQEWGSVGTGGWLTCGLRGAPARVGQGIKPPHPSHSPPCLSQGKGGHHSPALSQLLRLCSEGSMG